MTCARAIRSRTKAEVLATWRRDDLEAENAGRGEPLWVCVFLWAVFFAFLPAMLIEFLWQGQKK